MQIKGTIKTIYILVMLLGTVSVYAQKEFIITGKIVDAKGNPAIADVFVPCGDIVLTAKSDANGIFEGTYSNVCEGTIWVTSAIDSKNFDMPFSTFNLPPEYYQKKFYKT